MSKEEQAKQERDQGLQLTDAEKRKQREAKNKAKAEKKAPKIRAKEK